ncbi:unnamed protein product [Brachionus calyciflorus]|uniref:GIY-YIG domain-containing protein n=1 Tax=Brachionus calyciflorus TaxID=104777 RepID=A0A813RBV2_9BILA|nr:unnamed protein product [Brachionus calyciflorus]
MIVFNRYLLFEKIKTLSKNTTNSNCSDLDLLTRNKNKEVDNIDLSVLISRCKSYNISIQLESLKLREYIFKNSLDIKPRFSTNLSKDQLDDLLFFIKYKPFIVCENDKNLGFSIVSKENYEYLCNIHLNDEESYEVIRNDPLEDCIDKINKTLFELTLNSNISQRIFELLLIKNKCDLGKFRILPKIHKNILLKPFVENVSHILKDSQQLLQDCEKLYIDKGPFIYSGDFESLYTNMEPNHCCNTLTEYLKDKLPFNLISPLGQRKGVAMGCKCGPRLANLYIFLLERHWLSTIKEVILYARFIDDILIIAKQKINLSNLFECFLYLKLNIKNDKKVEFLDLIVSYDKFLCKLKFNVFIKPTNNGNYLLPSSNHPDFIYKNIPLALFTSIRRICTSLIDYLLYSFKISLCLLKRNYDFNLICKISNQIGVLNRSDLLPYKNRSHNKISNSIKTCFAFDSNLKFLKNNIRDQFLVTKKEFSWLNNYDPFIFYKLFPNLAMLTVHNSKIYNYPCYFFTDKCQQYNCKICNYIFSLNYVTVGNKIIPLMSSGNCDTSNIVYIILCIKCNEFYIGETSKTLRTRIYQHLYSIKKFRLFLDENVLGYHFRSSKHNIYTDFRTCIFKKGFSSDFNRKSIEADLIQFFKNILTVKLINSKFPFFQSKTILSFAKQI